MLLRRLLLLEAHLPSPPSLMLASILPRRARSGLLRKWGKVMLGTLGLLRPQLWVLTWLDLPPGQGHIRWELSHLEAAHHHARSHVPTLPRTRHQRPAIPDFLIAW